MTVLVRLPELTVTEARLLARMLELAPIEASLSAPEMPPGVAEELKATAASMRTAILEAITTAERTVEDPAGDAPAAPPMEDWIINVYGNAVTAIAGYFSELGVAPDAADHNARACLARLAHLEPPLTVERIA